jgi:hypothetical protein
VTAGPKQPAPAALALPTLRALSQRLEKKNHLLSKGWKSLRAVFPALGTPHGQKKTLLYRGGGGYESRRLPHSRTKNG